MRGYDWGLGVKAEQPSSLGKTKAHRVSADPPALWSCE